MNDDFEREMSKAAIDAITEMFGTVVQIERRLRRIEALLLGVASDITQIGAKMNDHDTIIANMESTLTDIDAADTAVESLVTQILDAVQSAKNNAASLAELQPTIDAIRARTANLTAATLAGTNALNPPVATPPATPPADTGTPAPAAA